MSGKAEINHNRARKAAKIETTLLYVYEGEGAYNSVVLKSCEEALVSYL